MERRLTAGMACALALFMTTACGGGSGSGGAGEPAGQSPVLTGKTPGPPAPPALRGTAGLTESLIAGKFTLLRSTGALDNGTALELDAGSSPMEWGVYAFDPGANAPDSLAVSLDAQGGAWIGLADYSAGAWEWHGPLAAGKTLAIDEARYLSPDGNLYCTVLAEGGSSATVSALSVRTINLQNELPAAAFSPSTNVGFAPLSVDFDAGASTDSDGTIVEYAWDWDGDGLYEGFSDQPQVSHVFAQPGIYDVTLRVSDEQFGRDTASVSINVGVAGNISPSAGFITVPDTDNCSVYDPVSFDAAGSSDPDGSLVRYDWDFDGDGSWEGYDSGAQVEHTYLLEGVYDARLRVTDDKGAQALSSVQLDVGPPSGDAPTASFTAEPPNGLVPLDVVFDGSASADDGSVVLYEWDWDGDGSYDAASGFPSASHTYSEVGIYGPVLRVTDNTGQRDTEAGTVIANLNPEVIDSSGNPVFGQSMTELLVGPAWAYYSADDTCLYFRRSNNDAGTNLADRVQVDDSADVGKYPNLQVVNGNPAIAYLDLTNSRVMYVRASNAAGSAWNAPIIVESGINIGRRASLAIVNGLPSVAYVKGTDVKFAQATDASGTTWSAPVVASAGSNGSDVSLAEVNGYPAVAYWDSTNDEFEYARANDAAGSSWGAPLVLDASGTEGIGGDLVVVTGVPVACYCVQSLGELRFIQATDSDGASWLSPVVLDSDGNCGQHAAMGTISGVPAIAYAKDGDIAYIRCNNTGMSSWSSPRVLNASLGPYYASIEEINGELAVSSQHSTGDLMYFRGF